MTNRYPVESFFHIEAAYKNNNTYLSSAFYSQPLKTMSPFTWGGDGIKIFMMSSAPGLLEGDCYDIVLTTKTKAKMLVTGQSYEKIFPSESLGSKRTTDIRVAHDSYLRYSPLPTTPYRDSIFDSRTQVKLADKSAKFSMLEILTAGRTHMKNNELFCYKRYKSLVDIVVDDQLIYRDNTNFEPAEMDLSGFGFYEGYSHLGNILLVNFRLSKKQLQLLRKTIADNQKDIIGGVTFLASGDVLIRLLGYTGQSLTELGNHLIDMVE